MIEPFPLPDAIEGPLDAGPPPAAPPHRRRVYLAGPISKGDLVANINQATDAFVQLARAGLAPWCPQWSCFSTGAVRGLVAAPDGTLGKHVYAVGTAAGGGGLTHADWLDTDLAWVGVAEAVLRLPGESTGADVETAHARALGIPVFDSVEAVVAWAGGRP